MMDTWRRRIAALLPGRFGKSGSALLFDPVPDRGSGAGGRWQRMRLFTAERGPAPSAAAQCVRDLPPPNLPYYALARTAADASIEEIEGTLPGLLAEILPVDFSAAWRLHLTYRYALGDVPDVLAWLDQTRGDGRRAFLVNSLLSAPVIGNLHAQAFGEPPEEMPHVEYTLRRADVEARFHELLSGSSKTSAITTPAPGSVLAFIGSGRDLNLLRPILAGFRGRCPVAGVLKKDKPELEAELRAAAGELIGPTVTYRELMRAAGGLYAPSLETLIARLARADNHMALHLLEIADVLRLAVPLLEFLSRSRPAVVIGAFEKSYLGALLPAACAATGTRLINVQHGLVPECPSLDLVRFDDFVVWDRYSAECILASGYRNADTLRVIGNPGWQRHRSGADADGGPLAEWKGADRLVVAFTQPAKWPFVTAVDTRVFLDALAGVMGSVSGLKLLIKQHESERAVDYPPQIRQLMADDRVRIVRYEDLSFDAAVGLADATVSISSTAILDALAMGKPSVACNLTGGHERSSLHLPAFVPIARTETELADLLDAALRGETLPDERTLDEWRRPDPRGYALAAAELARGASGT